MLIDRESTKTQHRRDAQRDVMCCTCLFASVVIVITVLGVALGVVVNRVDTLEQELKDVRLRQEDFQQRLVALETSDGTRQEAWAPQDHVPTLATTSPPPSKRSLQERDEEECLSSSDMSRLAVKTAFAVNENHEKLYAIVDGKANNMETEALQASRLANGCIASLTVPATTCTPPPDGLVVTGCTVAIGGGTCTVVAHTCETSPRTCPLTTELATLASVVDGKVDRSTLDDLLVHRANASMVTSMLANKADTSSIVALQAALNQKANASDLHALDSIVPETMPCVCAFCADTPIGDSRCVPFGTMSACNCVDSSGSTNPIRQTYPINQSDVGCCRLEWPSETTVTQARTSTPQVYDRDDIFIKVGGSVSFVVLGFENVEQVHDFVDFVSVSGGIRSGNPDNGLTFTHTFDTLGVYYFRSQIHQSLQAKVTVMDCVDCKVVAGYDGANLEALSLALSSRAPGRYALAVRDSGLARAMTFLTVYKGQTLSLTGDQLAMSRLATLDATITLLNGAGLVVDGTYISGGVSMEQQATLQDNTGHVVATTSGLALPMVVPTPAIVAAAIVTVDEQTDTVTLSEADDSIGFGQKLRIVDSPGKSCAVFPKATDLTVESVSGAVIQFASNIITGDASASSNCELTRAEVYSMPSCNAGDPPAVIYTRDENLDMDVLKACSEMDGVAAWRSVLTMGGVIFDSADIPGFIAAIGSGLPGKYVLRLVAGVPQFHIGELRLHSHQHVHVILSTPRHLATHDVVFTGDVVLATPSEFDVIVSAASIIFNGQLTVAQDARASLRASANEVTFEGAVDIATGSSFDVVGRIDSLGFPGSFNIAMGSTLSIESTSDRSIRVVMGTPWLAMDPTTNQGSVTFARAGLLNSELAVFGNIDGMLPGDLAVELDANQPGGTGEQNGIVSLAADGTLTVPTELNAAMGQVFTDVNIDAFLARVNSGAPGLIGLQLSRDNNVFVLGALHVVNGQDVRVFSTTSASTLRHVGVVRVTGGALSIGGSISAYQFEPSSSVLVAAGAVFQLSGSIGLTDTWLLTFTSRSTGTLQFQGGVTMSLPDGTSPTLEGQLPGTVVATLNGASVGSLTRTPGGVATGPTDLLGRVDRVFLDTEISDFVAAVNVGEPGLFALQLTRDAQVFEIGELTVVDGQDVRVFSTTSAAVQPAGCTTTPIEECTDETVRSGCEAAGPHAGSCTWDPVVSPWCTVTDQDAACRAAISPQATAVAAEAACEAAGAEPGDCTFTVAVRSTLRHTKWVNVTGGSYTVGGSLSALEFPREYPLAVATGATLRISGEIALPNSWLLSATLRADGTVRFDGGVTMPLLDGRLPTISGELPGTLIGAFNGATVGSARRDVSGNVANTPTDWYPVVVTIKAWGGGAGSGYCGSGLSATTGFGGAGGFAQADYVALPGDTLVVTVGNGGYRGQYSTPDPYGRGGFPNGMYSIASSSYNHGGGGGGASFVRGYTDAARDSVGVIVGAGGGGGGGGGRYSSSYTSSGGGGGGGTWDGNIGQASGNNGANGNGGRGVVQGQACSTAGESDYGGAGGCSTTSPSYHGTDANGAGGERGYSSASGGGGGAASFKNIVPGTARTVDATDNIAINTADPHYSPDHSRGGRCVGSGSSGVGGRGLVVLLVGGEATTVATTFTTYSTSYPVATVDAQSNDVVIPY